MVMIDNTQLLALVNDLEVLGCSLLLVIGIGRIDANDQEQVAVQAAVAAAAGTLSAKNVAHADLSAAVQALVDYVTKLVA